MSWLSEFAVSVAGALVAGLIAVEIKGWAPKATQHLLARAVRRLPTRHRERFEEEWSAHADELPTALSKLLFAIALRFAAERIRRDEQGHTHLTRHPRGLLVCWLHETQARMGRFLQRRLMFTDPEYQSWYSNMRVNYIWRRNFCGATEADRWWRHQIPVNAHITAFALLRNRRSLAHFDRNFDLGVGDFSWVRIYREARSKPDRKSWARRVLVRLIAPLIKRP